MLLRASSLQGLPIQARDGRVGGVADLLFEDDTWCVRWLVVDTGSWLMGRQVLLPASRIGPLGTGAASVAVDLSMEQVENSPGTGVDLPVSRQEEAALSSHYRADASWPAGAGAAFVPPLLYPSAPPPPGALASALAAPDIDSENGETDPQPGDRGGDPHLRSAREVSGYAVEGRDGAVGQVEDLLIDGSDWTVGHLIVGTGSWWSGKRVLLAPDRVRSITWSAGAVRTDRTRAEIKAAPEYDPARPMDDGSDRSDPG